VKRAGIDARQAAVPPLQIMRPVEPPEPLDFAGERGSWCVVAIAGAGIDDDLAGVEAMIGDQKGRCGCRSRSPAMTVAIDTAWRT
jgi:hypothetical protein